MNQETIDQILQLYYAQYRTIFTCFDFSAKADRFTEENQTVNFCQAVRGVFQDAVVWYEYPFPGDEFANRFDGVVYIPETNCLLMIEAKCLRHAKKYDAMHNDLLRICQRGGQDVVLKNANAKPTVYAVILADYWSSKKKRTFANVLQDWKKNSIEGIVSEEEAFRAFKSDALSHLHQPLAWSVEPIHKSGRKEYHLLTLIGEVKS